MLDIRRAGILDSRRGPLAGADRPPQAPPRRARPDAGGPGRARGSDAPDHHLDRAWPLQPVDRAGPAARAASSACRWRRSSSWTSRLARERRNAVTERSPSRRGVSAGCVPRRWPAACGFVAGRLAGVTLHPGFLVLAALGALGPTLLREPGLLRDQDEFQKQAAASAADPRVRRGDRRRHRRPGRPGVAGASGPRPRGGALAHPLRGRARRPLRRLRVALLGREAGGAADPRRLSARLWLLFVVLSHGAEPKALAIEGLVVVAPFFVLAALSPRFPRASAPSWSRSRSGAPSSSTSSRRGRRLRARCPSSSSCSSPSR